MLKGLLVEGFQHLSHRWLFKRWPEGFPQDVQLSSLLSPDVRPEKGLKIRARSKLGDEMLHVNCGRTKWFSLDHWLAGLKTFRTARSMSFFSNSQLLNP